MIFFIHGMVSSYLHKIGLGDLQNTQREGYGIRGSIKLTRKMKTYDLFVEPFVRYWNIHTSKVAQSEPFTYNGQEYVLIGEEPANTSLEIGGKLGVRILGKILSFLLVFSGF